MRSNIFDRVIQNPPKLDANRLLMIAMIFGTSVIAISFIFLALQLSKIQARIRDMEARPIAVTVGKDYDLVPTESLTPEQNAEQFIRDVLPGLFAWSKRVSSDVHSSGIDPGVQTPYGKLPTVIHVFSQAIEPKFGRVFRENVERFKPKNYDTGESTLLRIARIGKPKRTEEGWEIVVYADLITLDTNDEPYISEPFNNTVYLKEVLPPRKRTALTPIEQIYAEVQSRGLIITRISKYTD